MRDLEVAAGAGADALGFIVNVPSSPRNLKVDDAERLMKHTPVFVSKVLVTVPENINTLTELWNRLKPDLVQVHQVQDAAGLRKNLTQTPLIGAINEKSLSSPHIQRELAYYDAVLIDSAVEGKYGGTGTVHNWRASHSLMLQIKPKPLILAGGLTPLNVKTAIQTVQPYAVDVSTGVEREPGIKDQEKVIEFISKAKEVQL
jgi:phosphoribosylanthranilate isomerase